jgi:hypothetical protein
MSNLINLSSDETISSVDEWVYEDDESYLNEDYNEMKNLVKVGKIMNDEEGKNLPKFTQYVLKDGHYMPMQSTIEVLPAGYYKPEVNHYNGEIYATPKDVVLPKLYDLPNDIHKTVLDDIKHFWASEERYKKFGNVYKRNILLYSVPGNGKTSLINILANELIKEHNGIIISIDDEEALEAYPKLMQRVRQVEPDRKVITIIEDFERLIRKDYLSALLLQILDGSEQFNNVVTIATTNYPNDIGEQYTARPSRFNIKIEYKKPNEEVRKFYITQKLADAGIEIDEKVGEDIDRLVKKSEGYTFDFVKEVVQGIYVDDIPEDEIFERINDAIKRKGRYNTTENEPTQVGFSAK